MVDLGVYNFVKNALAAGKSKEQITADLLRGGMLKAEAIEEAFTTVTTGKAPAAKSAPAAPTEQMTSLPPLQYKRSSRAYVVILEIAILFGLVGGIAYLLKPQILGLQSVFHNANLQYQSSQTTIPGH